MPGLLRELVFISCAGFIGTTAAFLVPADQLAQFVVDWQVPGWLFLLALSVCVLVASKRQECLESNTLWPYRHTPWCQAYRQIAD